MGQDHKDWGEYNELFIDDISKLIENIGLDQKTLKFYLQCNLIYALNVKINLLKKNLFNL